MRVREAPLGELVARPLIRLLHVRRAGQSRADVVGEVAHNVHHLTVTEFFLAHTGDEFKVRNVRLGNSRCGGLAGRSLFRLLGPGKTSGKQHDRDGGK